MSVRLFEVILWLMMRQITFFGMETMNEAGDEVWRRLLLALLVVWFESVVDDLSVVSER